MTLPSPRTVPCAAGRRRSTRWLGLRALLGGGASGGAELPALILAALWLSALVVLPLGHALRHRASGAGHCHGAVCHDLDAGTEGTEIRDGTLPELGDLGLAHGDVVAEPAAAWAIARAQLGVRPHEATPVLCALLPAAVLDDERARGPPR